MSESEFWESFEQAFSYITEATAIFTEDVVELIADFGYCPFSGKWHWASKSNGVNADTVTIVLSKDVSPEIRFSHSTYNLSKIKFASRIETEYDDLYFQYAMTDSHVALVHLMPDEHDENMLVGEKWVLDFTEKAIAVAANSERQPLFEVVDTYEELRVKNPKFWKETPESPWTRGVSKVELFRTDEDVMW